MALNYTFNGQIQMQSVATTSAVDTGFSPVSQTSTINKTQRFNNGTGAGNCTQSYSELIQLAASAGTNLTLRSLTGNLNTNLNMTAAKGLAVQLLSVTDDSTYGTNCTAVYIGNTTANGAFTGANGWFGANANGGFRLYGGGFAAMSNPSAGGVPITATTDTLRIQNEDASNAAAVKITIFGLGTGG